MGGEKALDGLGHGGLVGGDRRRHSARENANRVLERLLVSLGRSAIIGTSVVWR